MHYLMIICRIFVGSKCDRWSDLENPLEIIAIQPSHVNPFSYREDSWGLGRKDAFSYS